MKNFAAIMVVGLIAVAASSSPSEAGCLTGAAVGGAVGHVAGHHGVLGAAVGCAVGHHRAVTRRNQYDDRRYESSYRNGPDRDMYGRDAYRPDETR